MNKRVNISSPISAFADLQNLPGSELNEACQILDNLMDTYPLLSSIIIRPGRHFSACRTVVAIVFASSAQKSARNNRLLFRQKIPVVNERRTKDKIKTLHSVSPLADEEEGRDPLYGNETDLCGLTLGPMMAQDDLECLSDVQSDSEFSSSSNSQYSFQTFFPPPRCSSASLTVYSACPVCRRNVLPESRLT